MTKVSSSQYDGVSGTGERVSFGRRMSMLAATHPDDDAIIFLPRSGEEQRITWSQLDSTSNRMARLLSKHGVDKDAMVVVGLPNCLRHFIATLGAWKLGACVLPLNSATPLRERSLVLDVVGSQVIVADWQEECQGRIGAKHFDQLDQFSDDPLPEITPEPGKAIASGGSTGRPKVIVDPAPWARAPGELIDVYGPIAGILPDQTQLVPGPLYHNAPFCWSHFGLFENHTLILMERFDALRAIEAMEQYQVNFLQVVPTMMSRIARLPDIKKFDLSKVEAVFHTAAPCPPWVKVKWIDLIGGDRLYEAYGSTENLGATAIRGTEWLKHRGSVGRPFQADLKILDPEGNTLPAGEVGEIFMRPYTDLPTYRYLGTSQLEGTEDGFVSVGDLGWVDEEGYLFIADRRVDMIVSGGSNVYPAEVEAALTQHEAVRDAVVIGIPDEDLGKRVHAVIEATDFVSPPDISDLDQHCRTQLAPYKAPKSYEFVETLPRNEAGKIRRRDLVAARARVENP